VPEAEADAGVAVAIIVFPVTVKAPVTVAKPSAKVIKSVSSV
jgi:hypothetical protein